MKTGPIPAIMEQTLRGTLSGVRAPSEVTTGNPNKQITKPQFSPSNLNPRQPRQPIWHKTALNCAELGSNSGPFWPENAVAVFVL